MNELALNGGHQVPKLSPRQERVGKILVVFNQLRAYKLDLSEVFGWTNTLLRIYPDLELDRLQMAVDGMISGEIPYDQSIGIKNIVNALRRVIRNDDGSLEILKPVF